MEFDGGVSGGCRVSDADELACPRTDPMGSVEGGFDVGPAQDGECRQWVGHVVLLVGVVVDEKVDAAVVVDQVVAGGDVGDGCFG